jgi:hypothetical protein
MKVFIADVKCCDCDGEVEIFSIPDKVWDGLNFTLDAFACMKCVAKRLNPNNLPSDVVKGLNEEIFR